MQDFDARFKKLMDAFDRAEKERARSAAEFDRRLDRRLAEFDRRLAAFDRQLAEEKKIAAERAAAFDRQLAEEKKLAAERAAEADRRAAEADRRAAEADRRAAELDRRIQKVSDQIGGFTNNYGEALEDEFAAALRDKKRIGGARLDDIGQRMRFDKNRPEYDIVGENGGFIFVGEIKHKFLPADVAKFADNRLPRFAEEFPRLVEGRKLMGMIGGGAIAEGAQEEAKKRGLIILRLRNRKLVVENAAAARPILRPA